MLSQFIPQFNVGDFEASYSFYTNHLGFEPMGHVATGEGVLLGREEVRIILQVADEVKDVVKPHLDSADTTEQVPQNNNTVLRFRFRDIKSTYEGLQKANIKPYQEPKTVWLKDNDDIPVAGLFEFSVVDPDGNLLVFGQELLPSESLTPLEERMEPIRPMKELALQPSASEKTMAFTDALLKHLPEKMKSWLHPCFITYYDYNQTLQLVFDTSRHMTHMLHLLESKQAFAAVVRQVFGENIRIEISSLVRQDETLRDLEALGPVMYLPIAADKNKDFQQQIDGQLFNLRAGHRSDSLSN